MKARVPHQTRRFSHLQPCPFPPSSQIACWTKGPSVCGHWSRLASHKACPVTAVWEIREWTTRIKKQSSRVKPIVKQALSAA
ncbi:hypothetical protein BaRGS_00028751 [Batillaria attramentaria]|uniref:Uncharacterized protein n=1 Tax=Batillaria attramentaria TaxID=370345 RepID=A0ABD0JYP4_9CAEN